MIFWPIVAWEGKLARRNISMQTVHASIYAGFKLVKQQTFLSKQVPRLKLVTEFLSWIRKNINRNMNSSGLEMKLTARKGKSSVSSIWTIWPIFGRLLASMSMQRRQTNRTRFRDLGGGWTAIRGSTISSPRWLATIALNQSTRFIWEIPDEYLL